MAYGAGGRLVGNTDLPQFRLFRVGAIEVNFEEHCNPSAELGIICLFVTILGCIVMRPSMQSILSLRSKQY